MKTNTTSRQSGHYNVSPLLKTTAVLLGLSAVLYLAVTPDKHPLSFSRTALGSALDNRNASTGPATEAPDARKTSSESPVRDQPGEARDWIAEPRECRAGIDTACIYQ